jgi:protein SCO1/2
MRLLPILLLIPLTACLQPKSLPILGEVPQFQLTASSGRPFDSSSLDGHNWVANFVFTLCSGPCPMMSRQMHNIQNQTAVEFPGVKLVSFTVDPANDTPPTLAAYALHFDPDPARWFFLTGDPSDLNSLSLNTFKLNSVDGSMTHSTRLVLVDRKRQIRGYYTTAEDGFLPKLMHDIRLLERDKS